MPQPRCGIEISQRSECIHCVHLESKANILTLNLKQFELPVKSHHIRCEAFSITTKKLILSFGLDPEFLAQVCYPAPRSSVGEAAGYQRACLWAGDNHWVLFKVLCATDPWAEMFGEAQAVGWAGANFWKDKPVFAWKAFPISFESWNNTGNLAAFRTALWPSIWKIISKMWWEVWLIQCKMTTNCHF